MRQEVSEIGVGGDYDAVVVVRRGEDLSVVA
jgi:hypothetical protein